MLETVTTISANCVCPTLTGAVELYGQLSLTVSLKLSVRETELNASVLAPASPPGRGPDISWPARIVESLGKILVGELLGVYDIQLGPDALVALATLFVPV